VGIRGQPNETENAYLLTGIVTSLLTDRYWPLVEQLA
jgi:hypothetical protein